MNEEVIYDLISKNDHSEFTRELNFRVNNGWKPIGNIAVALGKSQYGTECIYSILLQKVKVKVK